MKDFGDVQVRKSGIGQFQDGLGVFANRDFKKGEVVIQWNLKNLSEKQYQQLTNCKQLSPKGESF